MEEASTTGVPDAALIRSHVTSLFDAYLAGDIETLRSGRADDWKGFQIRSTRLIRGLDQYVEELKKVMGGLKVARYEFIDFEVDVFGDIALVYYLARDYLENEGGEGVPRTILIRSIDVYQRLDGEWTQTGSNICAISDPDESSVGAVGR